VKNVTSKMKISPKNLDKFLVSTFILRPTLRKNDTQNLKIFAARLKTELNFGFHIAKNSKSPTTISVSEVLSQNPPGGLIFFGKWEKGYHRPNRQQNSQGIALDTEKARVKCTQNHHPAPHNHMSSALLTWTWRGEQCYRTRRHAPSQRPETLRKKEKKNNTSDSNPRSVS